MGMLDNGVVLAVGAAGIVAAVSVVRSGGGSAARSSRGFTLNDKDRGEWLDNDEGLHRWWKRSRMSKREFIKENRAEIDNAIYGVPGMGHFRR